MRVFHQSKLELSDSDENWAKTSPLLLQIFESSNCVDSRIVQSIVPFHYLFISHIWNIYCTARQHVITWDHRSKICDILECLLVTICFSTMGYTHTSTPFQFYIFVFQRRHTTGSKIILETRIQMRFSKKSLKPVGQYLQVYLH